VSGIIDRHLAKAIIDLAIFLEFSEEDLVDANAAIGAMEQLAAELQLMSDDAKNGLVLRFRELAHAYGERAEFVEGLADSLGLSESN
jgi:hypothetical protein